MKLSNVAIILAAGNGTRMKMSRSKLLLNIKGKTVIERSVEKFLNISDIDEIIVVVREEDIPVFSEILTDERVSFVVGGNSRQQSVINAVKTIDSADLIVIHDGARPLVKEEDIEKALECVRDCNACALGVYVKDTIKIVDKENFVLSTPDRSSLFAVQTPQVFNYDLYKLAMQKAVQDNMEFTDDCGLVEYYGHKVKMVCGSYSNIKITTPDDIPTAESILDKGV